MDTSEYVNAVEWNQLVEASRKMVDAATSLDIREYGFWLNEASSLFNSLVFFYLPEVDEGMDGDMDETYDSDGVDYSWGQESESLQ